MKFNPGMKDESGKNTANNTGTGPFENKGPDYSTTGNFVNNDPLSKYENAIDKTFDTVNTVYSAGRRIGYVVMGLFFLLASVVLLAAGVYLYKTRIDEAATFTKTTGIVTELREVKGNVDVGTTYKPILKYKDKSGKEYIYTSANSSDPPAYDVGEQVEMFYNESNPKEAFINSVWEKWTGTIALFICGVVCFPIGLWMIFTGFRRNKPVKSNNQMRPDGTSYVSMG